MRREQILDPLQDAKDADKDEEQLQGPQEGVPAGVSVHGWRFRTVKVSNVPTRESIALLCVQADFPGRHAQRAGFARLL